MTTVPSPCGCRVGGGWLLVGGGEAAGGMNEFTPGSVAVVSTSSAALGLEDTTFRSSNTPAPAAAMSRTTSNAINHLRLDPVVGRGASVARWGPCVGGRTGAAPVAASWVSWSWMGAAVNWPGWLDGCTGTVGPGPDSGIVVASRPARANSTALANRWSGSLAIPVAMTSSIVAGMPSFTSDGRGGGCVMCATAICSRV